MHMQYPGDERYLNRIVNRNANIDTFGESSALSIISWLSRCSLITFHSVKWKVTQKREKKAKRKREVKEGEIHENI